MLHIAGLYNVEVQLAVDAILHHEKVLSLVKRIGYGAVFHIPVIPFSRTWQERMPCSNFPCAFCNDSDSCETTPTMVPAFDEAVTDFQKFLEANGYAPRIMWVTPADVVFTGHRFVYVKLPLPEDNADNASKTFVDGMNRGFGVKFGTLCELNSNTCCYVWVPPDKTDAEYAMMPSGLKMNAGLSKLTGEGVYNWLKWRYLRILNKKNDALKGELFR